jgi:hypothetical protein
VDTYTLADLERVTGAKRRSLQLWADAGVIEAERGTDRAGSGRHRLFPRKQAIVACIIRGFAERQMAIGELLSIADEIRYWLHDGRAMKVIESTINGTEDWMLILETWVDEATSGSRFATSADRVWSRCYNIRPVEIRTHEGGEAVVLMPTAFFDKPEALAQSLRLRTYLANMDVE